MRCLRGAAVLVLTSAAASVSAGPPYLTDDPVPTDLRHWEIYGFAAGEGRRSDLDQEFGIDLNYGAFKGFQVAATVPLNLSHDAIDGWRGGIGDLEFGIKYRFVNNEKGGFSAAIFPTTILPTANHAPNEGTRFLLPVWLEQDFPGGTSLFGGGGYWFNPGTGNRDFWQAAAALTKGLGKKVSVGGEVAWQQHNTTGGTSLFHVGIGGIVKVSDHYSLLASAGPTWAGHHAGYHFYTALGANF